MTRKVFPPKVRRKLQPRSERTFPDLSRSAEVASPIEIPGQLLEKAQCVFRVEHG